MDCIAVLATRDIVSHYCGFECSSVALCTALRDSHAFSLPLAYVNIDIEVDIAPQDYVAGRDPQLERAIAEVQRLLAEQPPALPDFGARPRLAPLALPEV